MTIVWSDRAVADLRALRAYIAEFDPHAAARIAARIVAAVEHLAALPDMGRPGRVPGTRELVVTGTPLIVPYRVSVGRIEIIAVIHGARKWPEL